MSYRSPARPKAERSSVVLALNDLKKATGGNVGKQMVSLPSRPVPLATRQSRISNASVNSNGSVKPRKSTTTINRMKSSSNVSKQSKKRPPATKTYDPIRLPEDILTIQAHTVSTPVTELPYLLIAAHIAALPTARQFYPPTSSTPTPLTVFRDMFVMTVDVRGYKPKSVRLSTEGQLIIIECLQTEVPQVIFTQTGTVDASDQYVMDAPPALSSMPIHTSFSYVQHRVKLPDDFSEEGLKVGMDDVSGHIIITGRLVHDQKSSFPEPWNKNKIIKKAKGPLVNTSCSNLSKEDARKLAAFHAVQGTDSSEKAHELVHTGLLVYGKKQWLEREGAKLRAIQHKALKDSIRRLTDSKKGTGRKASKAALKNAKESNRVARTEESTTEEVSKISDVNSELKTLSLPGEKDHNNVLATVGQNEEKIPQDNQKLTELEQKLTEIQPVDSDYGESDSNADATVHAAMPSTNIAPDQATHIDNQVSPFAPTGEMPAETLAENTAIGLEEQPKVQESLPPNDRSTTDPDEIEATEHPITSEEATEKGEMIEKQDKLMWEKLLIYAGVKGKCTSAVRKPNSEHSQQ